MTVKATLADVNKSLLEVAENTEKTSKGIDAFLDTLAADRRRELESEREAMAAASAEPSRSGSKGSSSSGAGFSFPSLGLGKLLTVGGLTTAAVAFGKGLLKRGVPGIALTAFADEIADYLVKGEGQEKLRSQFAAGLKGAGIGFTLFGRKGFVLGGIFEFLRKDPKVDEELGKLVDNLEVLGKAIFGEFSFSGIAKKITEKAGSGLESLNKLISGEAFSESNINSISKDIQGAATVLGVFGFLVSSRFRKALLSISGLKKLAVFTGLLKLAEVFGYTMLPNDEKNKMPMSQRPDALDYGVAGGTLAYGTYKAGQAIKNRFVGGPSMDRPIQKDYSSKFDEVRKMSKSQLKKVGIDKDGQSLTKRGGKIVGEADLDRALGNRYPRLFSGSGLLKLAKGAGPLALLSGIFTSQQALAILNDPAKSEKQKKDEMGELLGREVNAATFALIGGALMGLKFGPFGVAGGAIAGSLLSGLAPNVAGGMLADFFMGKGTMSESQYNLMTNPSEVSKRINSIRTGTRFGDFDASGIGLQRVGKSNIDASTIGANINPAYSYPMFDNPAAAGGGMSLAVTNNTNNQGAIFGEGRVDDIRDQLVAQLSY